MNHFNNIKNIIIIIIINGFKKCPLILNIASKSYKLLVLYCNNNLFYLIYYTPQIKKKKNIYIYISFTFYLF